MEEATRVPCFLLNLLLIRGTVLRRPSVSSLLYTSVGGRLEAPKILLHKVGKRNHADRGALCLGIQVSKSSLPSPFRKTRILKSTT